MDPSYRREITWQTDVLPRTPKRGLEFLSRQKWLKKSKWYLAGGTALAFQVGHRQSVDLDFFTPEKDFSAAKLISHFPKTLWSAQIIRDGTVYGQLQGAKISFIAYPFFAPGRPYQWYGNVRILDPEDIAVMKVIAISQRGRKRDFIDLYWCCHNLLKLEEIVERLPNQYPTVAHNFQHIFKSLTYFEDAENEPMPRLFFKATWPKIKKFFQTEVKKTARELLKLK